MDESHVREGEAGCRRTARNLWSDRRETHAQTPRSTEDRDGSDINFDSAATGNAGTMESHRAWMAYTNGRGAGQGDSKECGLTPNHKEGEEGRKGRVRP